MMLILTLSSISVSAQNGFDNLKTLYLNSNTMHFRSPERIRYLDLSTNNLIGEIPLEHIAKIKADGEFKDGEELGVITIIGNTYSAQYRIVYTANIMNATTDVEIVQQDMLATGIPKVELTKLEMKVMALKMQLAPRRYKKVQSKAMGLSVYINNIYTYGDYFFVDIQYKNKTNIRFDVSNFAFSIEDKKIYKATNSQSVFIEPIYQLYDNKWFTKSYRNIFVFRKFTYPNEKVFKIRIIEEPISGRNLELDISYRDILNADTF